VMRSRGMWWRYLPELRALGDTVIMNSEPMIFSGLSGVVPDNREDTWQRDLLTEDHTTCAPSR
jgi:hypothetical protein